MVTRPHAAPWEALLAAAGRGADWHSVSGAVCRGERPTVRVGTDQPFSQSVASLVAHCWAQSPSERPAFEAVKWKLANMRDQLAAYQLAALQGGSDVLRDQLAAALNLVL